MARLTGELDQLCRTAENAAHGVVFGKLVVDLRECFASGLRSPTIADLIDPFVDFALSDFVHTGSNPQTSRFQPPEVDVLAMPEQFGKARRVVGEARHRYRLGRERIDVELINLFTGHDGNAILSSSVYDGLPARHEFRELAKAVDEILGR
jgi:hypothetical protein